MRFQLQLSSRRCFDHGSAGEKYWQRKREHTKHKFWGNVTRLRWFKSWFEGFWVEVIYHSWESVHLSMSSIERCTQRQRSKHIFDPGYARRIYPNHQQTQLRFSDIIELSAIDLMVWLHWSNLNPFVKQYWNCSPIFAASLFDCNWIIQEELHQ